jgi:hypothetical protein
MEDPMADDTGADRLHELAEEFRWKLRHLNGSLNEAELEEMEAEFNEIISLARGAVGDA